MSTEISGKSHLQVIDELREELATVKALRAATVSQEELNRTEANRLRIELAAAKEALRVAINTVECASIDVKTGQELPWHAMARAVLQEKLGNDFAPVKPTEN